MSDYLALGAVADAVAQSDKPREEFAAALTFLLALVGRKLDLGSMSDACQEAFENYENELRRKGLLMDDGLYIGSVYQARSGEWSWSITEDHVEIVAGAGYASAEEAKEELAAQFEHYRNR